MCEHDRFRGERERSGRRRRFSFNIVSDPQHIKAVGREGVSHLIGLETLEVGGPPALDGPEPVLIRVSGGKTGRVQHVVTALPPVGPGPEQLSLRTVLVLELVAFEVDAGRVDLEVAHDVGDHLAEHVFLVQTSAATEIAEVLRRVRILRWENQT